jgi:hypothetical protein
LVGHFKTTGECAAGNLEHRQSVTLADPHSSSALHVSR